ncbi:hypothetical protein [Paenibacillus sp. WLX2291]|uniref:hypothetical protein n=1 Tax=Paenibacillus sp. WLX2291 TaxID=3296934 RepID=UPI003983FB01
MNKSNGEPFKKWWMWIAIFLLLMIVLQNINKKNEYTPNGDPVQKEVVEEASTSEATTEPKTATVDKTLEQVNEHVQQEEVDQATVPAEVDPTVQTGYVGIGGTKADIEAKYGENENSGDAMAAYDNKTILVMYTDDNRADNLSYEYEATDQNRHTSKDAMSQAKQFLPSDIKKIREYDPDEDHHVTVYKSNTLAALVPDYYEGLKEFGSTAAPGTVNVYTKQDQDGVYMFGIALGDYQ